MAGNTNSDGGWNIKKSYAVGVVEGIASGSYSNSGGIAGMAQTGTIENCYAWADVSSSSTNGETAGGIAGISSGGTISKCYAAGTVVSKVGTLYTYVGGIAGFEGGVSGCMALVSELDGGPSASSSRTVYRIGYSTTPFLGGNYALNDTTKKNHLVYPDTGPTGKDGEGKPPADFKSQALYTSAGWNFTAGTADWKFLSGYDYPVLSWQTEPPLDPDEAAKGGAGITIAWP
jgi:hypothetical protein